MIKICDSEIVEPLCLILDKCLDAGVYSTSWKRANILPIYKKSSRQNKSNYRQISLLQVFGKIFERLLCDVIYKHLCDNRLIAPNQSGFHPGGSTINQLLSITQNIFTGFKNTPSKESRAVFLDLSRKLLAGYGIKNCYTNWNLMS